MPETSRPPSSDDELLPGTSRSMILFVTGSSPTGTNRVDVDETEDEPLPPPSPPVLSFLRGGSPPLSLLRMPADAEDANGAACFWKYWDLMVFFSCCLFRSAAEIGIASPASYRRDGADGGSGADGWTGLLEFGTSTRPVDVDDPAPPAPTPPTGGVAERDLAAAGFCWARRFLSRSSAACCGGVESWTGRR